MTIEPLVGAYSVAVQGTVVAESHRVLILRENTYAPVLYFPRGDVRLSLLTPTDSTSHCPFKGDASYWAFSDGATKISDIAWSYEQPFDEAFAIREYLAFYADKTNLKGPEEPPT